MSMHTPSPRPARERGSAIIEFLLCTSLLLVPLLLGAAVVGLNVIRAVQVTELCRAAAHMYSENIDFSQSSNQQELIKVAQGLNITTTGGNGVVIFTRVMYVGSAQCGGSGSCTNQNQPVITNRLVIGNSSVHTSAFGTPPAADMDPSGNGNVLPSSYENDPATVATGFSSIMTMAQLPAGQYAYVAEAYFNSPDLNWWGRGIPQIASRFIF
jgi:hypothetical protein